MKNGVFWGHNSEVEIVSLSYFIFGPARCGRLCLMGGKNNLTLEC